LSGKNENLTDIAAAMATVCVILWLIGHHLKKI